MKRLSRVALLLRVCSCVLLDVCKRTHHEYILRLAYNQDQKMFCVMPNDYGPACQSFVNTVKAGNSTQLRTIISHPI